jgi:DNA-binding transcriptional LysR family regulator
VVIAPGLESKASLRQEPLYTWRLVATGSRRSTIWGRETLDVADLKGMGRLLTSPVGHRSRELLDEHGLDVRPALESESVDGLFGLAQEGWGIAVLAGDAFPIRQASRDDSDNWPVLCAGEEMLTGSIKAITRRRTGKPGLVDRFVDALVASVPETGSFANRRFIIPETRVAN